MNKDLKNILSTLNKDIEQDKLLDYINRNMSKDEEYAFEKQMNDDPFMNDAVEGLQQIENKKNITLLVHELNEGLKKQVEKKRARKQKNKLKEFQWLYFTIILLLLLIVIAFIVVRKFF